MCWVEAVAQTSLQAFGLFAQNSAQAKMAEAQARGATKEMNFAFQNYEIERQDAFDASVNDIIKTRINQMQLSSQVNAAIAEGYVGGGRTANRLMRAAQADTDRAVSSMKDNYLRKSNEIDLNKESSLLSTKDYISNLKAQTKPNKWGDLLNLAGTALSGYNEYRTQKAASKAAGGDWNFWKGSVTKKTGGLSIKTNSYKKAGALEKYNHYEY